MPKTEQALIERDKTRDIGAEILQAVAQMNAGLAARRTQVAPNAASAARQTVGLTQTQFARLLGVSARTLQEWEQGRRQPTPAAQRLLSIATKHPDVLLEELAT